MTPTCIRCGKPSGFRKDGRGGVKKYCGDSCYRMALKEANGSKEDQITRSERVFRANLLKNAREGSEVARQELFRLYGMVGLYNITTRQIERVGFV